MLTPSAHEDRRSSQGRLGVIRVVAMVCFAFLAVAFWVLQVIGNAKYTELADNNNLRTIPLRAPRGVFYDRNGKVLVENRPAYTIAIIRERIENANPSPASGRGAYQKALASLIHRLSTVVGVDEQRMSDTIKSHQKDQLFRPIAVVDHASDAQVAAVMARRLEFPEIVVQEVPVRAYPAGGMAAHLFGYVGEITAAQLADSDGLLSGAMVGKTGLEQIYNARLMGKDGKRDVVVNSQNREVEELGSEDPQDGQRIQLTIDSDLQRALEDSYKSEGYSGAAVFLDPRTGEVLALTSQPEYDPNDFADGINSAKFATLLADPKLPLTNRLLQGRYSPGSTFKILVAIAALSEGVITPDTKFTCNGSAVFYTRSFACDQKYPGHGTLDLRQAIEQSCNVYFFNVADRLGIDKIREYADKLGLAGKTGIDLPSEAESLVPSPAWKMKTSGERWYPSETISVGIGQGAVSVTPMSLAIMMSTVANGGTVVTPHVVKSIDEGKGWQPIDAPAPRSVFPIRPDVLGPVVDGLWMVVNGAHGTGSKARIPGHDVVGKTGTAQVISKEGKAAAAGKTDADLRDNSWFVFFASKDNPQIAGAVFVEHGGHGGTSSAPIVQHVLDTYFAKLEGRPLPPLPPKEKG